MADLTVQAGAGGEEVQSMARMFEGMTTQETFTDYVGRPGYGKAGKAIGLLANMYQVRYKKQGLRIFHYDATIQPVVKRTGGKKDTGPSRDKLQKVWQQAAKEAKGPLKKAFDQAAFDLVKNVYSPTRFPIEGNKVEIITTYSEDGGDDERDRWRIVISHAETGRGQGGEHVIDLDSIIEFCKGNKLTEAAKEQMLVAVQAMNILFRQDVSERFKAKGAQGRRFFGTEGAVPIADGGLVYQGFMQSFRFTQTGLPAIQLDTAYSAFVKPGMLLDVIPELLGMGGGGGGGRGGRGGMRGGFGGRGGAPGGGGAPAIQNLSPHQLKQLNGILRNAKFTVTHRKTNRVFTLSRIAQQAAADCKFLLQGRDGQPDKMVHVPEYFQKVHNVQVTKPRLPCVVQGKNYIPMEFVRLVEFNSIPFAKLSANQTADMIKVAAKPPAERKAKIAEWRNKLDWGNLEKVKAWNVEVNPNMMTLQGRVLPPPAIHYQSGQQRPMGGAWNMRGAKYAKAGQPLVAWSIVNLDPRCERGAIQQFVTQLVRNLNITNCPVQNAQPPIVDCHLNTNTRFDVMRGFEDIKPALQAGARAAFQAGKRDPQLIVLLLPNKDLGRYAEIKRCAAQDLKAPVVTQLLQTQKIRGDRGMDQYIGNVSMKIHAKLGGVTHHVPQPMLDKTTMMIGADVTHPPRRAENDLIAPSIAVSVAAISGDNNLFRPAIRPQEGRKETITDLFGMVVSHLKVFQKNTKALPAKIIMFRDGVSEGQYAKCATEEYAAILAAAREVDAKYRPKITFVVCVKRHAMRFFAQNAADGDRTGNLPPGTVVDTNVCHPFAFDFYLQAHQGLQGTARPTHYMVVKDDIGFDADKMQGLCNALCYSYARACRSVSLIPVAYYSDIIAGKCRDLIYKDDSSDAATSVSGASGGHATFDPLELSNRIENATAFNSVAWYM